MDERNVTQPPFDHPGEVNIGNAAAGVASLPAESGWPVWFERSASRCNQLSMSCWTAPPMEE
jgi:hypothetical protein